MTKSVDDVLLWEGHEGYNGRGGRGVEPEKPCAEGSRKTAAKSNIDAPSAPLGTTRGEGPGKI